MESWPFDLQPVRPDWDRLVGRRHVSAGAYCGQPPERGTPLLHISGQTVFRRNKQGFLLLDISLVWCCAQFQIFFLCAGKGDTGGDPCEAAGQSEVEPVWKTLLQVKFVVGLSSNRYGLYSCPTSFHSVSSLSVFVSGCWCFSICCTLWFSHCVVCIAPWRTFQRTTHSQTWTKPSGSRKHSMCVGVTTWLISVWPDKNCYIIHHIWWQPKQTSTQTEGALNDLHNI